MTSKTRAVIAALVLAIPVAVEAFWLHSDDGLAGHLAFAVSQLVGWTLVLVVVRTLGSPRGRPEVATRRAGRRCPAGSLRHGVRPRRCGDRRAVGARVRALPAGLPDAHGRWRGWGVRLLRLGLLEAGLGLVLVGALGFLAVAVGVSPWHDLAAARVLPRLGPGRHRHRPAPLWPTPAGQEQRAGAAAQTAGPVPG